VKACLDDLQKECLVAACKKHKVYGLFSAFVVAAYILFLTCE